MLSFTDQFLAARKAGVPLIGIESSDPGATMKTLLKECCDKPHPSPLVLWNSASGMTGYNPAGEKIAAAINDTGEAMLPIAFLAKIISSVVPKHSIVGMQGASDWLDNSIVKQAIWNLRDDFKRTSRTLVLLSDVIQLP